MPAMRPVYQSVTLEQLLNHRMAASWLFTDDTDDDRFAAVLDDAASDCQPPWPRAPSGLVAGAGPTGRRDAGPRLPLLQRRLRPRGLDAGGALRHATPTSLAREPAQPLGIELNWVGADQVPLGRPIGHEGKLGNQGPFCLAGPTAGTLDRSAAKATGPGLSIRPADYARWLQWHLKALRGERTPLADGYVRRLQALTAGGYALAGHSPTSTAAPCSPMMASTSASPVWP